MKRAVLILIAIGLAVEAQTISLKKGFRPTEDSFALASGVAVDATGVYVAGRSFGARGAQAWTIFLRKYDARGDEMWTRQIGTGLAGNSASPGVFTLPDLAMDSTGVYLVGAVPAQSGTDVLMRKYDRNGNELWTRQVGSPAVEWATGVAVDSTGVYVVGGTLIESRPANGFLRKYTADGDELFTRQISATYATGVAVDSTGVYVAFNGLLRMFTPSGNELWARQFGSGESTLGVAVDSTGVYVVGGTNRGSSLRKFTAGGDEVWTRQSGAFAKRVAADSTGVYVGGEAWGALPGQCAAGGGADVFARKYTAGGDEVWTRQFGSLDADLSRGLAVDATGVYLTGSLGASALLARFEKATAVAGDSRPRILWECVLNAASYLGGGVAPGQIVTIFGSAMGPSQLTPHRVTGPGRLPTELAETRILFNGVAAPLFYVSDRQSSAIVPYAVAGEGSVDVQVEYRGVRSDAVRAPVLDVRLGIFGVGGQPTIFHEDGSINSPSNPAPRGSVIVIYATGEGLTDPSGVEGQILGEVLPRPRAPVSATFSDDDTYSLRGEVLHAGGAPGFAGLFQVKVRVPGELPVGNVPLYLSVGSSRFWGSIAVR